MNRRHFLASTAGIACGFGLGIEKVFAQSIAGVDETAVLSALQLQQCNSWCWAACLSTFFNFYGHPLDQKEIVAARFGGQVVCAGDPTVTAVVNGLNRTWVDDNGSSFTSTVEAAYDHYRGIMNLTNRMIVNELNNGHPLYVATQQHAMVAYRVSYSDGPMQSDAAIWGFTVADPFPGFARIHALSGADIVPVERGGSLIFCATVSIEDN